ncbi:hypothetical protein CU098_004471, partial [Rhizopus stolonifer]
EILAITKLHEVNHLLCVSPIAFSLDNDSLSLFSSLSFNKSLALLYADMKIWSTVDISLSLLRIASKSIIRLWSSFAVGDFWLANHGVTLILQILSKFLVRW